MNPVRIFFAVPVPAEVREVGATWLDATRAANPPQGVRWTDPMDWHLTLRFVGSVPESQLSIFREAGREAARGTAAFRVRAGELGAFPDRDRARVLWTSVEGDGLYQLADVIQTALARRGIPREARAFQAHLTLGRLRVVGAAPMRGSPLLAEWRVTQFALLRTRSVQERRGADPRRYEIIEAFELMR